jgi:hypothetical protein
LAVPDALPDALSDQAQAEREKQARVIFAFAQTANTRQLVAAPEACAGHGALQLRAMNSIDEATKDRGVSVLLPSSMEDHDHVDSGIHARGESGSRAQCGRRVK